MIAELKQNLGYSHLFNAMPLLNNHYGEKGIGLYLNENGIHGHKKATKLIGGFDLIPTTKIKLAP